MLSWVHRTFGYFPRWPLSARRPFFFLPLPLAFVLSVLLHALGPVSGSAVGRSAGLSRCAAVCLWRPGIGKVSGSLSRDCNDWGRLNLSFPGPCILQSIVTARPCVSSSFSLRPSSLMLSAPFEKGPSPVSSAHTVLFQLGRICS